MAAIKGLFRTEGGHLVHDECGAEPGAKSMLLTVFALKWQFTPRCPWSLSSGPNRGMPLARNGCAPFHPVAEMADLL
jgi:hypothetical protein